MQLTRHKKADGIRLYTLTGTGAEFRELADWSKATGEPAPIFGLKIEDDEEVTVQFAYDAYSEKVMMHLRYLHKKARKAATPSVIDAAGNPMIVEKVPGNLYSDVAKAVVTGEWPKPTTEPRKVTVEVIGGPGIASGVTEADTLLTGIENDKEKLRKAITAAYAALDKAATAHPVNAEPVVQASFRDAPSITVTPTKPLLSKAQIAVGCIVAAVAVLLIAAVL